MTRSVMSGYAARSFFLWILVRLTVTAGIALAADPAARLPAAGAGRLAWVGITPATAFLVAALVAALILLDVRALRERTFMANIGVGLHEIAGLAFLVSAALEVVVASVARLFA